MSCTPLTLPAAWNYDQDVITYIRNCDSNSGMTYSIFLQTPPFDYIEFEVQMSVCYKWLTKYYLKAFLICILKHYSYEITEFCHSFNDSYVS